MKTYAVKEMFSTLQGEGYHAGTSAVFVRFAGCNFWSGLEKDRSSSACPFCDTDFRGIDGEGGGRYTAAELAQRARELGPRAPMVVLTGGEPSLQVDSALVRALKGLGFYVAIETNGSSKRLPLELDWICCSPKDPSRLLLSFANELKVIFPAQDPIAYEDRIGATHLWVQPEDGDGILETSTKLAIEFVKSHPKWRLSVQTHKMVGLK